MGMEPFKTAGGYRGQGDEGGMVCTCWLDGKRGKREDATRGWRWKRVADGGRKVFVAIEAAHVRVNFVNLTPRNYAKNAIPPRGRQR